MIFCRQSLFFHSNSLFNLSTLAKNETASGLGGTKKQQGEKTGNFFFSSVCCCNRRAFDRADEMRSLNAIEQMLDVLDFIKMKHFFDAYRSVGGFLTEFRP
jgi:hypothetical protein